jgi:hypothetical protein
MHISKRSTPIEDRLEGKVTHMLFPALSQASEAQVPAASEAEVPAVSEEEEPAPDADGAAQEPDAAGGDAQAVDGNAEVAAALDTPVGDEAGSSNVITDVDGTLLPAVAKAAAERTVAVMQARLAAVRARIEPRCV